MSIFARNNQRVRDFLPVTALAIAGLLLSIAVFVGLRGYYLNSDKQQFQSDATYYSGAFKSDVQQHVASLAAIQAFVSASHEVTRWEFSSFARQILPQNTGFKAVLWLPQLSDQQRKTFETNLQRDGLFGLRLRELTEQNRLVPAGVRAAYLPVAYVEPFESSGNLIGVDLSANQLYGRLMDAARETGRQVVSEPVSQALIEGAKPPILLVAFPLNRPKALGRRSTAAGPEGYVLGVLQLNGVIAESIGPRASIQARIGYGKTGDTLFSDRDGKTQTAESWFSQSEFHQKVPFTLAGKHFSLLLRSAHHGTSLARLWAPAGAALLVLALVAILFQSILVTVQRKHEVERAVFERTAELSSANLALNEEISQRRQAESELRLAKDKAEGANRAKSAFLSTMSHELRTPLNAIIGFSGLMGQPGFGLDAKTSDYVQEINRSGIRLLDLINDVLEITQMDAEGAALKDPVAVTDIVEATITRIKAQADAAGVSVKYSAGETLAVLYGDGRRLQKALFNLLSNAVKFNQKGGWVQLAVRRDLDRISIEVSDNGIGMPEGAQAMITKLFSQFDVSLARQHEGIGLGLTFVQRVANHHDAKLTISSRLGEGTTVQLLFPADRVVRALEVA